MKLIKSMHIAAVGFALLSQSTFAQETFKHCATDEMIAKRFKENPALAEQARLAEEADRSQRLSFQNNRPASQPYIIPVVFHIIHQYGSENISDAQVRDAVRIMNEDFQLRNLDTNQIVPEFKNLKGNAQFELRLAQLDPQGNCTNGIDRVYSNETNIGDDGSKLNYWNRSKYLNIWVVKAISSGAAGYSNYPSSVVGSPSVDGVMILSTYIGSIGTGNLGTSKALTHEVGHWANLAHTWGSTNQPGVACGDDGVSDTPDTKGFTSCNLNNAKICDANVVENMQNIMDYAYCQHMFTINQCTRMQAAMNSSTSSRNNLWSNANLIATGTDDVSFANGSVCAPKADFKANTVNVCVGSNVTFTDLSYNGQPTSRNWTFTGATPSTGTDSVETVVYNTPGVYAVTLVAGNATGSGTVTKTNYINVMSSTAAYTGTSFFEGFEGSSVPNTDWSITSGDNYKWQQVSTAKYAGTYSLKLNNFSASAGDDDEAISNTYDLTNVANPYLTFKVAYAQTATANSDRLRVFVSTNCGQTWTQKYSKAGTSLKTVTAAQVGAFTPTQASQWRTESVSLASVATSSNVRIKFEFTGDDGNNIYLDNINIGELNAGVEDALESALDLNVMPNPFSDNAVLSFNMPYSETVKIAVYDVLGKEVKVLANERLATGDHRVELNKKEIGAAGIYFVRINVGNAIMVKKIVLN